MSASLPRILACKVHNTAVNRYANNDQKFLNLKPDSDSCRTPRHEASTVVAHRIELDSDLKEIREYREEGSQRERIRKHDYEAKLDNCLHVKIDKVTRRLVH